MTADSSLSKNRKYGSVYGSCFELLMDAGKDSGRNRCQIVEPQFGQRAIGNSDTGV